MIIKTTRFGELEVAKEKIINFPKGLPGFEHLRQFVIVPVDNNPAFVWLQSVEAPDVAFLLVDPFLFFSGYEVELTRDLREELSIKNRSDVIIQAIVTIPETGIKDMTANLVGPVVINVKRNLGKQVVLQNTEYGTRHPLFRNKGTKEDQVKSAQNA